MATDILTENPFGVLTFIAAPALLTNASSVLAMSTINRLLRTRDRMHEMYKQADDSAQNGPEFLSHVNRVEKQALLLLNALHWIYTALGSFAAATLVTLLGALAGQLQHDFAMRIVIGVGLLLGGVGVTGLVGGCFALFHATQLSVVGLREEAESIRLRQAQRAKLLKP